MPLDTPSEVHTRLATASDGTVELSVTKGSGPASYTCIVGSWLEASKLFQQWAGQQYRIEKVGPHPASHRLVYLKRQKEAKPHTWKYYNNAVRASELRINLQEVVNRKEASTADDQHIAKGLGEVKWTDTRTITGATVWATHLLYRIKMRAYSTWNTDQFSRRVPTAARVSRPRHHQGAYRVGMLCNATTIERVSGEVD